MTSKKLSYLVIVLFIASFFACSSAEKRRDAVEAKIVLEKLKKPYSSKATVVGEIAALVGSEPITNTDIELATKKFKRSKLTKYSKRPIQSQMLDMLISKAIVKLTADEEYIRIPPARVENEIKKRMKYRGIKDRAKFEKAVSRELKMSFDEWKKELAFELKKEQIIQIRIQPPRPSDAAVKKWYNLNKTKVGKEINVREILFKARSSNIKDEIALEKELNQIRSTAFRQKNFAIQAKTKKNLSPHRRNGGLTGWQNLAKLAKKDIMYANQAFQLRRPGQISTVFRSSRRYYCLLQLVGSRFVPLEKVYPLVQSMIARENREKSFYDWIEKERTNLGVKIFLSGYKKN